MYTVEVVIETTKGSRCKYKYDPKKGQFKLKKILPAGLSFPYDFGFIPRTKGDDGDPLDILVVSEESFFLSSIVECTIIGAIKAEQRSEGNTVRNDRIIGVPVAAMGK